MLRLPAKPLARQLAVTRLQSLPHIRFNSSTPLATPPSRKFSVVRTSLLLAKYTAFLVGSTVVGILIVGGTIFIHDAFT